MSQTVSTAPFAVKPHQKMGAVAVIAPSKPKCERNPSLERESTLPRVRLLLDSQIGQLGNIGQLVKASSQLWSKLQKWLNKREKI